MAGHRRNPRWEVRPWTRPGSWWRIYEKVDRFLELAAEHGVHFSWIYRLLARYRELGEEGLEPRSKRPKTSPSAIPLDLEDEIVLLRKQLSEEGRDAGAETISFHLEHRHGRAPSLSTIHRVLRRRGLVTPQPKKRPKSSLHRFCADLPNECWQSDMSDNGCIYTAKYRGGKVVMETELERLGVTFKHSRPYHPQTCGKVERFHQTMKKYLVIQRKARNLEELQAQIDRFVSYYNDERPYRALRRRTPAEAFNALVKAHPTRVVAEGHFRIRHDRVDSCGKLTLRYDSQLRHIGMGRRFIGEDVMLLIADSDVRITNLDGELLRTLTLDPAKDYH